MLVAVILGNRLNDDGSISGLMKKRLDMALEIDRAFSPDYIILSGGIANPNAGVSEAQKMFEYLEKRGVNASKLVKEDKSLTTKQNAEYSVPLAAELGAKELLLCTSIEHMCRTYLNPVKLFKNRLKNYPDITLRIYSK